MEAICKKLDVKIGDFEHKVASVDDIGKDLQSQVEATRDQYNRVIEEFENGSADEDVEVDDDYGAKRSPNPSQKALIMKLSPRQIVKSNKQGSSRGRDKEL